MRTGGGCRTVDREISRFPRKERLHMPGSLTTPGRPALAMTRSDVLPSTICTVSAPKIGLFRGSMAGLCAPLSTLRGSPRGPLRMTRGRCGSLLLHRKGLAPSTPCRSPGASQMFCGLPLRIARAREGCGCYRLSESPHLGWQAADSYVERSDAFALILGHRVLGENDRGLTATD